MNPTRQTGRTTSVTSLPCEETPARGAYKRRHDERGAALLVVVLVITLLSAVGIFALRSASLVDVASGYSRQATQTMLIAEFAARTAAAAVTIDSRSVLQQLDEQANDPTLIPKCRATAAATTPQPCIRYDTADIFYKMPIAFQTSGSLDADSLPGFLGHGQTRADFHVEVFSLAPSGSTTAGNPVNDNSHRVSIQAEARIRPAPPGDTTAACSVASAPTTSVQTLRAHLVFVEEGT